MARKYSSRTDIDQLRGKEIFFDANILIYIFWPTASHNWEEYYARTFSKLLKQHNTLVVDFITISEFINRAIRIEYENYIKFTKYVEFKKFRDSMEGQDALSDIYVKIKDDILIRFEVVAHRFFKPDIEKLLVVDNLDFGDKGIIEVCKANNYILLTNDADFKSTDLEILTSNPAILKG